MIALLREDDVATAFRTHHVAVSRTRIAAPFWGAGAAKRLGLASTKAKPVEVICRFDSAACNPRALVELLDAGATIRTAPRLHAKVYLAGTVAIVGSSNPSRLGLNEEGDVLGGTIEANVLTDDDAVVGPAAALFDDLWEDDAKSSPVTRGMVEREITLREDWPTTPPMRALRSRSLLAACR